MAPLLEFNQVEKIFGGLRAIGGVSFQVEEKQIFGLIGPNGAGKTTIFNCIAGVYQPEVGSIRFAGKPIVGLKPFQIAREGIGRTFQNIRLFGQMSVLDNVLVASYSKSKLNVLDALLHTKRNNLGEKALRKRAEELLEVFELRHLADELSGALPYGSQRRLEIARALMLEPRLLLLDEPAAGMNSAEAQTLTHQVRWLRERFNLSIVLVEHNMQVVMNVCEHVHCVDHGETIASGDPEHVQNHPAVLAAYLGKEASEAKEALAELQAEPSGAGSELSAVTHGAADGSSEIPSGILSAERAEAQPVRPGAELALEVRDLKVSYGGIQAVKGISFHVEKGEIVTLIGANGAGKSSTLKALVGLAKSAGTLNVFNRGVGGMATHQIAHLGVALVPEGRAVFGPLSVKENLELGSYTKRDPKGMAERFERVVTLFPRLGERLKQDAGTLSGGEQQMLAIGRAMMADPKILLLDEPSLGLAPKLVGEIFEAICEIARDGLTILLVEQNTRLALETAARGYVLVTGEIALQGSSSELSRDPRVKAAYLGGDIEG